MSTGMLAIMKKDLKGITSNKRMLVTLLAVPLVLTIFVPTVMILVLHFAPDQMEDFQKIMELLALEKESGELEEAMILLNYMFPIFFLIIPVMASSVMSAISFVGEKEKRTLETLLYSPLSLKQIFQAKVMASFLLSLCVSFLSFLLMLLVLETEAYFIIGSLIPPALHWLLVMLLVSPAISLIAITLIVRVSAKAQSVEDAQQGAVFLILPLILLLVSQFTGVLLINGWILLAIGILCAGIGIVLLQQSMNQFQYESLLK